MQRIFLGLAIHNHQPLGNFPWVFEDSYRKAYLPMAEALERHPAVKVSLHYSGCLADWLDTEHPEFFELLAKLLAREQVELMGGGYYEPILPMIPDSDKRGQIRKMSSYIQRKFGCEPTGMWLTERVWEPHLAGVLADCGIRWTLVDDTAFKMSGAAEGSLVGYYKTEDCGREVNVFPISKYLRYSIPWHDTDEITAYLKQRRPTAENPIIVMGDDGEKFGVWPETYEHCWQNGWIESFFTVLEENADWLQTTRLGDYVEQYGPTGRVYLPCASYDEMMEWALPTERSDELVDLKHQLLNGGLSGALDFMQGGFWRNFLVKYPEGNRMYRKMLQVQGKIMAGGGYSENSLAVDYLWKGQCNCPYWHGVFGGIYLADIRAETYSNLIKAENCIDEKDGMDDAGYIWQQSDFDGDGDEEVTARGKDFSLYFSPREGGTLFELDLHHRAYNLLSTISRRPEPYHREFTSALAAGTTVEESGKIYSIHEAVKIKARDYSGPIIYDRWPRSSLTDHFIGGDVTLAGYEGETYADEGDFAGQPYECRLQRQGKGIKIILGRTADIATNQGPMKLRVEKTVTAGLEMEVLEVDYMFTNMGGKVLESVFAGEWNINLLGGGHNPGAYCQAGEGIEMRLDSRAELTETEKLLIGNNLLGIELKLRLDRRLTLWLFPVESLSNSEGGIEQVYQCSCIVILLPLILGPGQHAVFHYEWTTSGAGAVK